MDFIEKTIKQPSRTTWNISTNHLKENKCNNWEYKYLNEYEDEWHFQTLTISAIVGSRELEEIVASIPKSLLIHVNKFFISNPKLLHKK